VKTYEEETHEIYDEEFAEEDNDQIGRVIAN